MKNGISPRKGITPRYARDFKCSGSDCPDTCCQSWNVNMDQTTYQRLQQLLPPPQMEAHIRRNPTGNGSGYAAIVMNADGYCPFLDSADRLCTLHKQHGAACLSQICRQYPRQISLIGDTLEQGLNISCPEAARHCLLDDSAMDLFEFDPQPLAAAGIGLYHTQKAAPENCYHGYLNDLREIMLQLLANRNIPLASRLFVALYFARQISPALYEGVTEVDDRLIVAELEQMLAPGYMDDLHQQFAGLPADTAFSKSLLQCIILARLRYKGEMSCLIPEILNENGINITLASDGQPLESETELDSGFDRMLDRYQRQLDLLKRHHAARIDRYFENYSRNFWFKDLFIKSPSPLHHMQKLIVRLAVAKFLFVCHPRMNRLLGTTLPLQKSGIEEEIDEVAVSAFYQFSRIVEHDRQFMAEIDSELARQGMDSFAHMVLLLKF